MGTYKFFVGSLSFATTNADLIEAFSPYGTVILADVLSDKMTGKSKGFGFVEIETFQSADFVVSKLNQTVIRERAIFVDTARPREEKYDNELKRKISKDDIDENFLGEIQQELAEKKLIITPEEIIPQIELSNRFNLEFLKYLNNNKLEIYKLSSIQFEEMVAEIWRGFQYEVILTPQSRDGGKDIIAIKKDEVNVKYYIECKKYSQENKVSIDVVKKFHSTIISDQVTKGIIATTSFLTKPAINFIEKNMWQLESKDIHGIWDWVELYIGSRNK